MCALKVSLSTGKVKPMPAPDNLPSAERVVRLLRLASALSVLIALIALATIMNGDLAGKGRVLIVAAIALGACALVGMAILILPHTHRRKDRK